MVIYRKTAAEFLADVDGNSIVDEIRQAFILQLGSFPSQEVRSWANSLQYMERIVRRSQVREDCGVLIEYRIPASAKRIDFAIAGINDLQEKNIVIIELKQWETATTTAMKDIVVTVINGSRREVAHPSYQAHSYKLLLADFNESIEEKKIAAHSCAYLHNYDAADPEPLASGPYSEIVKQSPVFFKHDTAKLQEFLRKHVLRGKGMEILFEIESGRIRPAKKLIDHVRSLYEGNEAFTLIDAQKVAFERALGLILRAKRKTALIIRGGPGTGKSVISMRLLGELLKLKRENIQFVAPNAAFRDVILATLLQGRDKVRVKNLFSGSAAFYGCEKNFYHSIIVDEAHRLKDHRAYMYKGRNQVQDIMNAAFVSVFFVDDSQKVRPEDIGSVKEIKDVAKALDVATVDIALDVQYRCAGAEGFVNWLDDTLHVQSTGNFDGWDRKDFEFKIFDDPNKLHRAIREKQKQGQRARMLAGYAWKWTSEREGNRRGEIEDVTIPEHGFRMAWNSRSSRSTWAIDDAGIDQVGCIHTSQGLEFDYVGVIVGPELEFDPEAGQFRVNWKNYRDNAGKKGLRNKPEELSQLVRNIYRTLMSRALRGCYVYACNPGLAGYLNARLKAIDSRYVPSREPARPTLVDRIEAFIEEHLKFTTHVPVYSIQGACGHFANGDAPNPEGWVRLDNSVKIARNMFAVQAIGSSMEPTIKDRDLCVFRTPVIGTRENKVVLVQHHGVEDPEYGGSYTIKRYTSRKKHREDGAFEHEEITLEPLNPEFQPIRLSSADDGEYAVVGEFVCVVP